MDNNNMKYSTTFELDDTDVHLIAYNFPTTKLSVIWYCDLTKNVRTLDIIFDTFTLKEFKSHFSSLMDSITSELIEEFIKIAEMEGPEVIQTHQSSEFFLKLHGVEKTSQYIEKIENGDIDYE